MIKPNYISPDGKIRFYNCSYERLFEIGTTWDLAIVDPPYGIDFTKYKRVSKASNGDRYISNNYKKGAWDKSVPNLNYFDLLFKNSKDQIIWGGNYFGLSANQCFIFWYKQNPVPNFSDGEYAWTSFNKPAKCFNYKYYGNLEGKTIASEKYHPTQKPIALYKWQLKEFAKPNQSIIDTHGGSMSHAIAVHDVNIALDMNLTLDICEIDTDYFNDAVKRFKNHVAQKQLF